MPDCITTSRNQNQNVPRWQNQDPPKKTKKTQEFFAWLTLFFLKIIINRKGTTDIHRSKVNTVWSVSSNTERFSLSTAYWVYLAKTLEPCCFLPCSSFKLNGWNCFCLKSTFSRPRSAGFIAAPKPNRRANEEEWRGRGGGEGWSLSW